MQQDINLYKEVFFMIKFFKAIGKLIRHFFKKKSFNGGNASYQYSRYISKWGGDIIPGDIPIPVGDELQCTLFKNDKFTYAAMCIEEKILFIIPWHYYEYIIKMNNEDIDFDNCDAEYILDLMYHATIWNKEDKMSYDSRYNDGSFIFFNTYGAPTHTYSLDNGDYTYLKMRNVDD